MFTYVARGIDVTCATAPLSQGLPAECSGLSDCLRLIEARAPHGAQFSVLYGSLLAPRWIHYFGAECAYNSDAAVVQRSVIPVHVFESSISVQSFETLHFTGRQLQRAYIDAGCCADPDCVVSFPTSALSSTAPPALALPQPPSAPPLSCQDQVLAFGMWVVDLPISHLESVLELLIWGSTDTVLHVPLSFSCFERLKYWVVETLLLFVGLPTKAALREFSATAAHECHSRSSCTEFLYSSFEWYLSRFL